MILPTGFAAAGIHCGIKPDAALDLGVVIAEEAFPATVLHTRNKLWGAHIPVMVEHLLTSGGLVRAVLVNSGNANCATGKQGEDDCRAVATSLARHLRCPVEQVLFLSTGAIGKPLPLQKIQDALPALVGRASSDGLEDFARAILTTDKYPKVATGTVESDDGDTVQITGIAKGSSMIHPDMATMIALLMTDAKPANDALMMFRNIADRSFHRLTVDGDTSPNDTAVLWYANRFWCRPQEPQEGLIVDRLLTRLTEVSQELCQHIAADGEGATRLVTVHVEGAMSEREASLAARAIGKSPLVKAAIHGHDPNWGRILSAAASSEAEVDMERVRVRIGDLVLYEEQEPHPEHEAAAAEYLRDNESVDIGIDLAKGPFQATGWSCDLSPDYIRINANHRT